MKIFSPVFEEKVSIPSKYSCDGENINPPLEIMDIPKETKTLSLVMDDPDIPEFVKKAKGIEVFDHWIVFNIRFNAEEVPVFKIEEGVEPNGERGVNSSGGLGYMGPCPPDGQHRYFFKAYALNSFIDLPEGISKVKLEKTMNGSVIDYAEFVGVYERI